MTKTEVKTPLTTMDTNEAKQDVEPQQTQAKPTPSEKKPITAAAGNSKKTCKKHSGTARKSARKSKSSKNKKMPTKKKRRLEKSDIDTPDSSSEPSSSSSSPSSSSSSSSSTSSDSDQSDSDSESSDTEQSDARKKRRGTQRKRQRRQRKAKSKHESSCSEDSSIGDDDSSEPVQNPRKPKGKTSAKSKNSNVVDDSKERKVSTSVVKLEPRVKVLEARMSKVEVSSEAMAKPKHAESKKNKCGPKPRFKRVDHVWDEDNHRWKQQETVKDPNEAMWDKYAFTVRRIFDWEQKYLDTVIDIKSKPLKDSLKHILDGVSGISMAVKTPNVDPNMLFLFLEEMKSYATELKAAKKDSKDRKSRNLHAAKADHLNLLIKYIDKDYADTKKTLHPLLDSKTISFDLLWALFKPNSIIFSPTYGDTDEPRAFKIEYAYKQSHPSKGVYYQVEGHYLEYDGKVFGLGKLHVEVPSFKGIRKVASLNCYPLEYHQNEEEIRKQLITRGEAFVSLKGTNYRQYSGMAYVKTKKGVQKLSTYGRVMVDPASFRRINPNYLISTVSPSDAECIEYGSADDSESDCCCDSETGSDEDRKNRSHDNGRRDRRKKKYRVVYDAETDSHMLVPVEYDDDGEEMIPPQVLEEVPKDSIDTFTEEDLLIASPVALGFSFHDKTWLELKISALSSIVWNEDAFDSLVLPSAQKGIIKALVESHKFHPAKNVDDVISGKGKGLVGKSRRTNVSDPFH